MSLIHEHLGRIRLEITQIFNEGHCVDNFDLHLRIDGLESELIEAEKLVAPFKVEE